MGGEFEHGPEQEDRFRSMFQNHFQPIHLYVRRRVLSDEDAGDLVADVFTAAWRRIDQVPEPPEDLLWLYGTARRTISEHRRSTLRRRRLSDRLKLVRDIEPALPHPEDSGHDAMLHAVSRLRPDDAEALRLVLWDELSHAEAAVVLECSVNAVGIRVHRAKQRLRAQLRYGLPPDDAPVPTANPVD